MREYRTVSAEILLGKNKNFKNMFRHCIMFFFCSFSLFLKVDLLERTINSNAEVEIFHKIQCEVHIVPRNVIAARILLERLFSTDDLLRVKQKAIINVPDDFQQDSKCFPQAIVIGRYLAENNYNRVKTISFLFKNNGKLFERETNKLIMKTFNSMSNYNNKNAGSVIDDLYKFQKTISDYSIYIFNDILKAQKIVYSIEAKAVKKSKKIFLYLMTQLNPQHIIVISDVKRFFGREYFCHDCNLPYTNKTHTCF